MNADGRRRFPIVDGTAEKFQMTLGNIGKIAAIRFQRGGAAMMKPRVGAFARQDIKQHFFVISEDKGQLAGVVEFDEQVKNLPGLRAAIDRVAKNHELIRSLQLPSIQQGLQGHMTAMNVADNNQSAHI